MENRVLRIAVIFVLPAPKEKLHEATDHNWIAGEQILDLVQREVVGVRWGPEALAHKVIGGIETGALYQFWELFRVLFKVFDHLSCVLDVLERDEYVDENFLIGIDSFDHRFRGIKALVILYQSD